MNKALKIDKRLMSDRIKKVMSDQGIKNSRQLAMSIDMDPSFFNKVLNNGIGMSDKYVDRFCSIYGVNENWLKYGTNVKNSLKKDFTNNILNESDIPLEKVSSNDASIQSLIESNKMLTAAHLKQVENEAELIQILKRNVTDSEIIETQQAESAKLRVLQELLVQAGVPKLWASIEEGEAIVCNMTTAAILKGREADTHAGVDR